MIDHLSYSAISTYLVCARSWHFRYVEKPEVATAAAMVFGSAFHKTMEEHITTAFAPVRISVSSRWSRHWQAQIERDSPIDWGSSSQEKLDETGMRMLTTPDIIAVLDAIEPLVIEEKPQIERYVTLGVPGVSVPIVGYIDVIEKDGVPCDLKTSARAWSRGKAQDELQPLFYLAALNQSLGFSFNPELKFRHYVFTKAKSPKVQIWETQRTIDELFWLFKLIREVWYSIEREAFPPSGVGSWKCNAKYCEYWHLCRGGNR